MNRFKIINKTKEGCILDFKEFGGKKMIPWEDFNKVYQIKDLYWAEETPEFIERKKKLGEKIDKIMSLSAEVKSKKNADDRLKCAEDIKNLYGEINSEFGLSAEEVLKIINKKKALQNKKKISVTADKKFTRRITTFGDLPAFAELKRKIK